MPRDRLIDDGRRRIHLVLPSRVVVELDRLTLGRRPWRTRTSLVVEALEAFLDLDEHHRDR